MRKLRRGEVKSLAPPGRWLKMVQLGFGAVNGPQSHAQGHSATWPPSLSVVPIPLCQEHPGIWERKACSQPSPRPSLRWPGEQVSLEEARLKPTGITQTLW